MGGYTGGTDLRKPPGGGVQSTEVLFRDTARMVFLAWGIGLSVLGAVLLGLSRHPSFNWRRNHSGAMQAAGSSQANGFRWMVMSIRFPAAPGNSNRGRTTANAQ